ncbi:MAG: CaiB/BaiF CoA transferase family protein [Candidatus Acidiferrales bacterium]
MTRPLQDLVVLDLTQFGAGPYCTMFLADFGAEVIKIEPPDRGEAYRHEGPRLPGAVPPHDGGYFLRFNRNKQSVCLDLRHPDGRRVFEQLCRRADVLVENFKPESMGRLGLSYEHLAAINPRLVYASISGFGHADLLPSPLSKWPAFAVVAEAVGGVMDRIGDVTCEPHWSGVSLGDLYAGLLAFGGVLAAVHHRLSTGCGQHVDVAMADGMASLNERAIFLYNLLGEVLPRGSESHLAPFGAFLAEDGYVAIGVIGNAVFKRFCAAIGRPDLAEDPRLSDGELRAKHVGSLIRPAIAAWLKGKTKSEAAELLVAYDVPAAPVLDAKEVAESPHMEARHMLVEFDWPGSGRQRVVGNPIKLGADLDPPVIRPPLLGEHTDDILLRLAGVEPADLRSLREQGVI